MDGPGQSWWCHVSNYWQGGQVANVGLGGATESLIPCRYEGHCEETVSGLVTRIAATSNRKSLATAIATQKNHCDSENTCKTAISLRFLREKLATSKF